MLKANLNLRKMVAIAICLAGITMFSGCSKDDEGENFLLDGMGFKEAKNEGDPYIFTSSKDGACLKVFAKDDIADSIFFYDGSKMIGIKYNEDEQPVKIYAPDFYCLFTNYQATSVLVTTYNNQGQMIKEENMAYEDVPEFEAEPMRTNSFAKQQWQPCGYRNRQFYIPCHRNLLYHQGPVYQFATGVGMRTQIITNVNVESTWSSENAKTLDDNFNDFANNINTNGILHYEGGLAWDKPVPPPPPNPPSGQKGCWIITCTVTCTGLVSNSEDLPVCELTEAEVKEVVRKSQEIVNQALQGSGCNGNYTYRRQ